MAAALEPRASGGDEVPAPRVARGSFDDAALDAPMGTSSFGAAAAAGRGVLMEGSVRKKRATQTYS